MKGNAATIATLAAVGALFLFAPRAKAGTGMAERLIKRTESLSLTPYQDEGGTWHAGYGHKLNGKPDFARISRSQAEQWLQQDMQAAALSVDNLVDVELTPNQRAALISFVYNLGGNAFKNSTLLKKLNNGDFSGAAGEFSRWIYVDGNRSRGLMTRREAEKRVFLS